MFNIKSALLVSTLFLSMMAHAANDNSEIYCEFRPSGKNLDCFFFNDLKKKNRIQPNQLSEYVDTAAASAFITVKSRAGSERTFMVDPKSAPFVRLAEMKKSASASELSREKISIFEMIEKRAIDLSNSLDAESAKPSVLRADPDVSYNRYVSNLLTLQQSFSELQASCSITSKDGKAQRDCYNRTEALALAEDNQNLTRYLTDLLNAMQVPNSCLGDKKLKVDKDGSVDLSQVPALAKAFRGQCTAKGVAMKGGASVEGPDYHAIMMKNNKGVTEAESFAGCVNEYSLGPFVITTANVSDRPVCYGVVKCGGGKAETSLRIACEARGTGTIVYCPKAQDCFKAREAAVWSNNVRVAP